jgi:hypothetical protein
VRGISTANNHDGVVGQNTTTGNGVLGVAVNGTGVHGQTQNGSGVYGQTANGDGVSGQSADGGAGIRGISANPNHIGVVGENSAGGKAGGFFGDVLITGNLALTTGDIILANADCAEEFDVSPAACAEPGNVMVLDETGSLAVSCCAYDRRAVGVISGAGDYRPGIVLDRQGQRDRRSPIALLGKVYCKADASYAAIAAGDLLTTSLTPGHAMRATDPVRSFGAVIGKALAPLSAGQGLVPVLIALQ